MSGIDIDDLTDAELIDLKRRITERLKTQQNFAKALKPRLDKLSKAGISLNEIFRRADIARSNWSRWINGHTGPTLKTHTRLMAVIEKAEEDLARQRT